MTALSSSPSEPQAEDLAEPAVHPLFKAARMIGQDMLSTLIYAALFAATHDLILSTGVAIGAGLVSIALNLVRRRPIERMQWMSLFLVVVFGGAGLLLHDARFVMIKPTIIYIAVGLVMIRAGWMASYLPLVVRRHGGDIVRAFEGLWALVMFATAAANLVLVVHGDLALWTLFLAVVPIASKIVLVLMQYATLRIVVPRRIAALGVV
jgi:intracellular septation protein A